MTKAQKKRARKVAAEDERNDRIKAQAEKEHASQVAMLIMHDDNSAMIQVFKTGRNPTMRTLGRVHGISICPMHETTCRDDFALGPISHH